MLVVSGGYAKPLPGITATRSRNRIFCAQLSTSTEFFGLCPGLQAFSGAFLSLSQ